MYRKCYRCKKQIEIEKRWLKRITCKECVYKSLGLSTLITN